MKDHLKIVPSYLIPPSMQAIATDPKNQSKRKKKRKVSGQSQDQRVKSSKMRDPLRNPSVTEEHEVTDAQEPAEEESKDKDTERIFSNSEASHLGRGISGRKEWKMRHHKGPFKKTNPRSQSKRVPGTFQGKKRLMK
jgi:hypothetical protein